jgi:hypothetical protein
LVAKQKQTQKQTQIGTCFLRFDEEIRVKRGGLRVRTSAGRHQRSGRVLPGCYSWRGSPAIPFQINHFLALVLSLSWQTRRGFTMEMSDRISCKSGILEYLRVRLPPTEALSIHTTGTVCLIKRLLSGACLGKSFRSVRSINQHRDSPTCVSGSYEAHTALSTNPAAKR